MRKRFHHLGVSLQGALALAPGLRMVLSPFEDLPAHVQADIRIELEETSDPSPADARFLEYKPCFFVGKIQGFVGQGGILLSDWQSRVEIRGAGRNVVARIHVGPNGEVGPRVEAMLHLGFLLSLRHFGLYSCHAAAAYHPERGLWAVLGEAGAGKSTTLLCLLTQGFRYLGDDKLLVQLAGSDGVRAFAYPRKFHLGKRSYDAWPGPLPQPEPLRDDSGKLGLRPSAFGPAWLEPCVQWGALLLPQVVRAGDTAIERVSAAEAFGALLTSSAWVTTPEMTGLRENLECLRRLAAGGNAYQVALGPSALGAMAGCGARLVASIG